MGVLVHRQLKTVDQKRLLTAYLNIGQLQSDLGNYEAASKSFLEAASHARQTKLWRHPPSLRAELLIQALNSAALCLGQLEQHEEAALHAQESLRIAESESFASAVDSRQLMLARC